MSRAVPVPPLTPEGVRARPLATGRAPRRLVLVRLHAFGDTVGLLPLLGALRERFPGCRLEVVTGSASADLFRARSDVDAVHPLDAWGPRLRRAAALARIAVRLRSAAPDGVLDLQRSRLSRALTALVRPPAFAAFDRFAPEHGLERYLAAAAALGLGRLAPLLEPRIRPEAEEAAARLLEGAGREPGRPLVCLNPAGGWTTRRWPLERYAELGRRLAEAAGAQPLLLGAGEAVPRLRALARELGTGTVDLAGRTSPGIAMAVLARASLAVSDDSGLMHLAWTQGVPTLALFGASRAVWCRPLGPAAAGFYSEDLECGACMRPACVRGDVHCLQRVEVDAVLERALGLLRAGGRASREAGAVPGPP